LEKIDTMPPKHARNCANANQALHGFAHQKQFEELSSGTGFLPYAAPSTGAFGGISPQGRRMDAAR